jgi:hypothetical protein
MNNGSGRSELEARLREMIEKYGREAEWAAWRRLRQRMGC